MIIGLTGKNASGKDTAARFLQEKGFVKLSLSDEIREICSHEGLKVTRDNLIKKAIDLRTRHGTSYLADRVIQKLDDEKDYVVVSLRHPAEVKAFRRLPGFTLVSLDSPAERRFRIMKERGEVASREEFDEYEKREAENEDPAKNQLDNLLSMADVRISNTGSMDDLRDRMLELTDTLE